MIDSEILFVNHSLLFCTKIPHTHTRRPVRTIHPPSISNPPPSISNPHPHRLPNRLLHPRKIPRASIKSELKLPPTPPHVSSPSPSPSPPPDSTYPRDPKSAQHPPALPAHNAPILDLHRPRVRVHMGQVNHSLRAHPERQLRVLRNVSSFPPHQLDGIRE